LQATGRFGWSVCARAGACGHALTLTLTLTLAAKSRRRHHLEPARASAQLFELTNASLLAPSLILCLADSIDRLSLVLAQALKLELLRTQGSLRSQVRGAAGAQRQTRSEYSHSQPDLLQILPADVRDIEATEQLAREDDQAPAGGSNEEPAVRQGKDAPLNGPGFEGLARDQHGAQMLERLLQAGLLRAEGGVCIH
jgi:hypothetical protein